MSFSYSVKEELSRLSCNKCCQKAELVSLIKMAGTIQILGGKKRILLQIRTVHAPTARRIYKLLRKNSIDPAQIAVKHNNFLKDKSIYIITVDANQNTDLLKRLEILPLSNKSDEGESFIDNKLINKRCCKRAFLRGAFLGGGSISNPRGSYHMEFVTQDERMADILTKIISDFGINPKVVERKSSYIIYLKGGDYIADMLAIMGANNSLFKYEDIRVIKNMRNSVNRMVNCETANLKKTIDASMRQIESIKYFKENNLLDELPENLRQIALLRLEYPDLSLKELGQINDPVLGKSGVSYRLKKIEDLAHKLQNMKGD